MSLPTIIEPTSVCIARGEDSNLEYLVLYEHRLGDSLLPIDMIKTKLLDHTRQILTIKYEAGGIYEIRGKCVFEAWRLLRGFSTGITMDESQYLEDSEAWAEW